MKLDQTAGTAFFLLFVVRGGLWVSDWSFLRLIKINVVRPNRLEALINVFPSFGDERRGKSLYWGIDDPQFEIFLFDVFKFLIGVERFERCLIKTNWAKDVVKCNQNVSFFLGFKTWQEIFESVLLFSTNFIWLCRLVHDFPLCFDFKLRT